MPIYEYLCDTCQNKFELLCSIKESEGKIYCPKCSGLSKKVFSRFASFSKDGSGASASIAGTGSSCGSCTSASCSSCH